MNRRIKRKKLIAMSKLTDEEKKAAVEAGKQGVKDAYEKTKGKALKWCCLLYTSPSPRDA